VLSALSASNIILPSGNARIGTYDYDVALNSSPEAIDEFKKIPIKVVGPQVVTIGDVADVSDAFSDQTNIVRVNGRRATYLNIMKKADASTLDVVTQTKKTIPDILATAPKGMNLHLDFDQSVFVRSAIMSVLREALISSALVSLMILLFLGSWKNVIVVCTSIPLAILTAIIGLKMTGNSINIMTLGGLSLAIGMLVDDATVEVENIHRNRSLGLPITRAILTGAEQIALPAIMATLAICIVFFPVVLITGPAKYLFTPMALSVVLSMMASYVLSRTLVPLLSRLLLVNEIPIDEHDYEKARFPRFAKFFLDLEHAYKGLLTKFLHYRSFVLWSALGLFCITMMTLFVVGRDFFPVTDTGLMKIHFRAPSGTRIEETEKLVAQAEERIRKIIPEDEISTINSMLGVPTYFNLAFVSTDNVNGGDAEIFIALKEDHAATQKYVKKIRDDLNLNFPGAAIYFQPPDIVSQVLNFGVSAPIDVQIEFSNVTKSYEVAQALIQKMKTIPGATDVTLKQVFDYPTLRMDVDRVRAAQVGVSQRDVANSMLISLSGSQMVAPSFYLNPSNNVNYPVVVKVPMRSFSSVNDLLVTPISTSIGGTSGIASVNSVGQLPQAQTQRLGNVVSMRTGSGMSSISHNNVQRVLDITANVEGRDLGSVSADLQKKIKSLGELPSGMKIVVRGQGEVMNDSFKSLGLGLIIAIFLVYLLMVVLFQSWIDPFIVMVAVPGALMGILWMLLITGTTINVSSFMGSIMAVGIAASNSILLVNFANDLRIEKGLSPLQAALEAGATRLRPILMTACAMILGMLPAALALGEGGEQNAPLGRAVIGGLLIATCITLFVVPIIYSLLRIEMPEKHKLDEKLKTEEAEGL
jgi:multidrug efflux pump subunit AcrB